MKLKIAVVAAVNDNNILNKNLLQSSLLKSKDVPFFKIENAQNAGQAYNEGIALAADADADVILFAHQDVYLPENWYQKLISACKDLQDSNIDWGVLGLFGNTSDGQRVGQVWDSGLGRELGKSFSSPVEVETLDELLLVVNNQHGLRFDENLPGFHLYGSDICAQSASQNIKVYVINAPAIHNSKRHQSLGGAYTKAYKYMQKKWKKRLPIQAVCSPITRFGVRFYRIRFGLARRRALGLLPSVQAGNENPKTIASDLGYE